VLLLRDRLADREKEYRGLGTLGGAKGRERRGQKMRITVPAYPTLKAGAPVAVQ
jgi:hypothetical protein